MKPEPVPQSVVCTACGLSWDWHEPNRGKVTLSECVRLLRAELLKRPIQTWTNSTAGNVYTIPSSTTTIGNPAKSA
jgi:hypothetical protein